MKPKTMRVLVSGETYEAIQQYKKLTGLCSDRGFLSFAIRLVIESYEGNMEK